MGTAWYYTRNGEQQGPVEFAELRQMAAAGALGADDLVWNEGMPQWVAASSEPSLVGPAGAPIPVASAAPLGYYSYTAPGAQQFIYAGFWLRFLAYLVDYVLMYLASLAIGFAIGFGIAATMGQSKSAGDIAGTSAGLISIVIFWLYWALQESSAAQATLGKRMLGLKVTNLAGERISFARATGRYFGKILSGLILAIGFIMASFTERKQALHDIIAGTLVIKAPKH